LDAPAGACTATERASGDEPILCGTYPNAATYYWVGWSANHSVGGADHSVFTSFNSNTCDGVRNLLNVDVVVDNPELGNHLTWNQNAGTWDYNGANGVPCC
jgi:hypothetical protein